MNIEAYFERIGYKHSRDRLDLETLTDILQHQIQAIPFENLNIHCGDTMELDLEALFDQIVVSPSQPPPVLGSDHDGF